MKEKLGQLFCLHEQAGMLHPMDTKPMTREDADDFILSRIQADGYLKHSNGPPPVYWVPLDAFQPLPKTKAGKLTAKAFECGYCGAGTCTHYEEEDD